MRSFLRSVLSDLVATITTVGLSVMVGFLAWVQAIPWYQLALGTIFAFGGSLFLVNQLRTWWSTRRIKDDIWLSDAITHWLLDTEFTLTKLSEESSPLSFSFSVEDQQKRRFVIYRNRSKPDDIHLTFTFLLTDEQRTMIDGLGEDIKGQLIEDIRMELARLGILYSGVELPLTKISVETLLPIDIWFDRFRVIQHALVMMRANVLLSEHISHAVRIGKGRSSESAS